ncbi:unnamed protein product [Urochloa humidicola]
MHTPLLKKKKPHMHTPLHKKTKKHIKLIRFRSAPSPRSNRLGRFLRRGHSASNAYKAAGPAGERAGPKGASAPGDGTAGLDSASLELGGGRHGGGVEGAAARQARLCPTPADRGRRRSLRLCRRGSRPRRAPIDMMQGRGDSVVFGCDWRGAVAAGVAAGLAGLQLRHVIAVAVGARTASPPGAPHPHHLPNRRRSHPRRPLRRRSRRRRGPSPAAADAADPNSQLATLADLGKGEPENGTSQPAGAGTAASSGKGAGLAVAAAVEHRHRGCEERRARRRLNPPPKQSSPSACFQRFQEGVSDGCFLLLCLEVRLGYIYDSK